MPEEDNEYYAQLKDLYHLDKNNAFLISLKALIIDQGKLLVARCSIGQKLWALPGGLLDYNEPFEDGLKREVKEETNLDIEIQNVFNVVDYYRNRPFLFKDGRKSAARTIEIYYLCKKISGEIKLDWENSEYKWITKEEFDPSEYYEPALKTLNKYFIN